MKVKKKKSGSYPNGDKLTPTTWGFLQYFLYSPCTFLLYRSDVTLEAAWCQSSMTI